MINRKIKIWGIVAAITAAFVALTEALFLEKYFFEVKRYSIGKKDGSKKIKIVFLTDLHFRKSLWSFHRKLVRKINELHPDLIVISGDVIDEDGMYAPAKEFFSLLTFSIPKMGIMGNHDHKSRVRTETYRQLYGQNNGCLLINESKPVSIGDTRLMITGVDDFIEGNASFAKAVKNVGREENHILLIHSPLQQETILQEIKELNHFRNEHEKLHIQYIFAGHNHGGQVCILGYAPILPKKAGNYLKGWYNSEAPFLYLSKGFGTSTLPFRFGARSEVTIFEMGV